MPRTSFRGFFSLLRALYEKNDLGQFLHVSCLFWSPPFRLKNILLEAHTWSNKSFWMSERRIWRFQGSTTLRIVPYRDMHVRASKCLMLAFFFKWFNHLREPLLVLYSCLVLHFVAFSAFYVLYTRRTTSANFCMFLAFFGLRRSDWKISC